MTKSVKGIDDLIAGIERLLLENRYSFSEEDIVLLNQCLTSLKKAKMNKDLAHSVKVLKILATFFDVGEKFKDLF